MGRSQVQRRSAFDQSLKAATAPIDTSRSWSSVDQIGAYNRQLHGLQKQLEFSRVPQINLGLIDSGVGLFLNRAGPGQYSSPNGDTFTQADLNGVINDRTAEFHPTN